MYRSLLLITLCLAASAHADDSAAPDCSIDREAMLALDEPAFDQSLPDGGWRSLDRPGCHAAAAELIAAWRVRHPHASPTVAWHEGQMLAQAGRNADAIPRLREARKPEGRDPAGWNHYLDATVAFLQQDRASFDRARDALAVQPYPDTPGMPPLVNGYMELPTQAGQPPMRMRWPPNLDIVEGLSTCFDRAYSEAYGPACRATP